MPPLITKLILIAALAYLALLMAIYVAQTSLLFPTRLVPRSWPLPAGAEQVALDAPDGIRLHGVYVPPCSKAPADRPVILGFGGNAWNAAAVADYLHGLYPDHDVAAFHFRGYAPSAGKPSAAALLADAPLVHDFVSARLGNRRVVAVGFSIGSGIAAHLAGRRRLAGLILVTPFDSLETLAADHYRWLPIRLLLRHRMNPADDLRGTNVPVTLIAGERDTLIPPRHAQALARVVPNLVLNRTISGAGHNDIYHHPAFRAAMTEALQRIEKGSS